VTLALNNAPISVELKDLLKIRTSSILPLKKNSAGPSVAPAPIRTGRCAFGT